MEKRSFSMSLAIKMLSFDGMNMGQIILSRFFIL